MHARPIFLGELAVAQARLADAADRAQHAEAQLLRRHFHAEDAGRDLGADRRVLGDIDREARVVHDDIFCDEVVVLRDRQVVDLALARRFDGNYPIPVDIAGSQIP